MPKNLVLVKFNKSADKSNLFEIPLEDVVFAGEFLLVKNIVGAEQEVVAICDSFVVMDERTLDRVCDVNGTTAKDLKRAIAFVNREVCPFEFDDVKEYEGSGGKDSCDHHASFVERMERLSEQEKHECAYEVSREIAQAVADVCGDLGIDCGKITITISEDEESED